MYGRGYTQNGDQLAARFIAKNFQKNGVKTFGKNYFQKFELNVNTFPKASLQLDGKKLEVGKDFIVKSNSTSGKGNGQVLVLDTLIFSDKQAQENFLKQDFSTKILVLKGTDLPKIQKLPFPIIQKIYQAQAHLILQKKLTMSVSSKQEILPSFEVLENKFVENTQEISFLLEAHVVKNYETQNLIGYVDGTERQDSCLVFTAHYDHLGELDKAYFAGANDNASGVAMLLELAAYFSKNPHRYRTVFMAFSGEEAGLLGSGFYVKNPIFPLSDIRFLMNLDLLGTGDDGAMVVNATVFEKEFALLQKINSEKNYLPKIGKRGKAANSDHYFFTEKGVPSFFIYLLGGIQAYHDVDDLAESLPLTRFDEVFDLLIEFSEKL